MDYLKKFSPEKRVLSTSTTRDRNLAATVFSLGAVDLTFSKEKF